MSNNAAKCWTFTKMFGGPGQPTEQEAKDLIESMSDDANYIIYGREKAPSTGQLHFQGYVQFETKKRLTQMRQYIAQCHFEIARGSDQDNYDYCSKEGEFVEIGARRDTTGGKRGRDEEQARWKKARLAACENKLDDVPDDIFVRCYSSIKSISKDYMKVPPDTDGVCGLWIYGPPGVGKSRKARADYPGAYFKLANKWWDGYKGEKYVILDDLDPAHSCLGHHLKIWADRYGFIGEIKGGAIPCRPDKFVVTSNYSPEQIFSDPGILEPIRRRFKVMHMRSPTEIGIDTGEAVPAPAVVLPPPTQTVVSLEDLDETENQE